MLSVELSSCYVFLDILTIKNYIVRRETSKMFRQLFSAIFLFTTTTAPSRPVVFSVNSALTCNCAALLTLSVD